MMKRRPSLPPALVTLVALLMILGAVASTVVAEDGSHGNDTQNNTSTDAGGHHGNGTTGDNTTAGGSSDQPPGSDGGQASDHGNGGGKGHGHEADDHGEHRDVNVHVNQKDGSFNSRARNSSVPEDIGIDFQANDGAIHLAVQNRTQQNSTLVDLHVTVTQLLEYRDANQNGRYDPADPVVQVLDVRTLPVTLAASHAGAARGLTATYQLPGGGIFQVEVLMANSTIHLGNATLNPREAKMNLTIKDFPYQASDTALAVRADVSSNFASDGPPSPGVNQIVARGSADQAFFRWAPYALVDGHNATVASTVYAVQSGPGGVNPTQHEVFLSYGRGSTVVHDPVLGVATAQSLLETARQVLGDPAAYALAFVFASVAVGGLAAARTRPKR